MHDYCRTVLVEKGVQIDLNTKDGPLLQLLGTEWGRKHLGEDVWVDALKGSIRKAKRLNAASQLAIVVDDMRFENEFDGFPEACKIRLEASKIVRMQRCEMWREQDEHPSEVALDEYSEQGMFDIKLHTDQLESKEAFDFIWGHIKAVRNVQ